MCYYLALPFLWAFASGSALTSFLCLVLTWAIAFAWVSHRLAFGDCLELLPWPGLRLLPWDFLCALALHRLWQGLMPLPWSIALASYLSFGLWWLLCARSPLAGLLPLPVAIALG